MKTSYILLTVIAFITLTGMVTTDVLFKQQYEKIDWRNPYYNFEQRSLPVANHWVIDGVSVSEILIEQGDGNSQAWVAPDQVQYYQAHQQNDTVFVKFKPEFTGYQSQPRDDAGQQRDIQLVLRLPGLQTLRVKNARLSLGELAEDSLLVNLQNSRLRTNKLTISDSFSLMVSQNSFAVLGPQDQYKSLQTSVKDSSGLQLDGTQIASFSKEVSTKGEVQLRGNALKWLK